MSKKPIQYTYEDNESGKVSEPSAAMAYNQQYVHMDVIKKGEHTQETTNPELMEMMREQEEAKNDPAWAEWAKGLTTEEWSALGEYYDSLDEDNSTQWIDADVAFAEMEKEMKEYARKIGKDY